MVLPHVVVQVAAVVLVVAGKPVVASAVAAAAVVDQVAVVQVAVVQAVVVQAVVVQAAVVQAAVVQAAVVQVAVVAVVVVVSVAVAPFAATMMKIDSWLMFLFYIQYGKCIYCLFCNWIGLDWIIKLFILLYYCFAFYFPRETNSAS